MSPDVATFAQVMTVITVSTAALIGVGLGTRVLWRLGSRAPRPAVSAASREEMERLQTAIDAIAIEVERISEAQSRLRTSSSAFRGSTRVSHGPAVSFVGSTTATSSIRGRP